MSTTKDVHLLAAGHNRRFTHPKHSKFITGPKDLAMRNHDGRNVREVDSYIDASATKTTIRGGIKKWVVPTTNWDFFC